MGNLSTVNEYTDGWGNLNVETTTASTDASKVYTTKTATTFKTSHVTFSGLPTRVEVSKTNPDGASVTRTVAYTYSDSNGLRESETIEPDAPALKLTTTYDRSGNKFGLVNKQTQSWTNPACADANWPETGCVTAGTRVVSDTKYDAKGRFPEMVSNAVGLSESRSYDAGTGMQLSRTDVNGLITSWALDSFGRVKSESRPDGTQTRVMWKQCAGDCPGNAATLRVTETYYGDQRFSMPQVEFADSAGHVVRHHTWGFDGKAIVNDSAYDSRGRLQTIYHPRNDPAPTYTARVLGYDVLSRVTEMVTYDEGNNAVTAATAYRGLERVIKNGKVTNGKAQTRTESRNVLGQLIQVTDANDGVTKFGYDPFGNLNKTTDPGDHVIEVDYDTLGRKIELRDPDLGKIQYAFNPLGQIWRQINPKQRTVGKANYFGYDMLDRMTARYEPDLNSVWVYDSADMGKGQLAEAYTLRADLKKDYHRVHSYDPKGRPLQTTLYLTDNDYISTNEYDGWGRLIAQSYKRGKDVEKRIDRRYNGAGYLSSIERGAMKLWQVSAQDAANRPTSVVLGNGLVQTRTYNEYSARLTNAQLAGNGTPVLQEGYSYDVLGNVTQRTQHWGASGFDEMFDYDNLNRLHTSTLNGDVRTFTYTADGNMLTKTGVGSGEYVYTQGGSTLRPHAVKSITGMAGAFEYDDNGNLISGNGRTTSWTSFDMPLQITKGAQWSSFTYGPEHQRSRQDRNGNAWIVYAGGQEVESVDGQVTVKTYWPNGIGVEIDRSNGTTELNWTHLDRLGSVVAISKADGSLAEPLAYDAWGKRRMLTSQSTPDSLDGVVDNKGYTGHEMLDQLDLVHMNGRVYDPLLARFLSGDPLVQDPVNGQSYSRYAYVFNNPTNYTDPSGFEGAAVQSVVISRPRESADMWMVNNWAQRFLSDAQTHAERMRTAMSGARSAVSRIPVRSVAKVAGRFVLVNGGRVVGGTVGGALSAGCDIITAGGCAPLNPVIVTAGVLTGAAAGNKLSTMLAEALDAGGKSEGGTNNGPTNNAKPPKDPQAITNPPQAPPIPDDWTIAPNPRRPGGIIATPPGVTPGSSDKGSEHIRVDPPGSSPVPGLEEGYWRWNRPGVGAYNPDKNNFGGTQGQTHIPLPPGYPIPKP